MAIAFDVASDNGSLAGPATSVTWAHTCTGSNRILFACFFGNTTDTVTGVTYNNVAMTFVNKVSNTADRWIYVYMLVNPASGANNIVASGSSSLWRGLGVSYTGAAQSGQPDASGTNSATAVTGLTGTITTVAANAWAILLGKTNNGDPAAGTGSTQREVGEGNGIAIFDSNAGLTAGSNSMAITSSLGNDAVIMVSFSPFIATATVDTSFMTANTGFWG